MAGKQYPLSLVIKAVDQITAPLARITSRISAITRPVQQVSNSLKSLSEAAGVPRLTENLRSVAGAASAVGSAVDRTALRVAGLGYLGAKSIGLFNREFIGTADLFDRLDIQLEGLMGSRSKATEAMAFLKDLTIKTPFEMPDLAKSFRTMLGFGLDPRKGNALQAIADQTSKIGGTGEDLTGIAMQLGQAWSKGRLQAQDANILVERGVPVWGLLQRAVERVNKGQKVSIGQLRQMSEDGQLGTKALTMLIEQMGIEAAGATTRMMKTWSGMFSNLRDHWALFKLRIMRSGPFDLLKSRLKEVLDGIGRMAKSGELDRWADRIGARFLDLFTWLEARGPAAWQFMTVKVPDALVSLADKLSFIKDLVGGWDNLAIIALGTYIGGPLISSVFSLTSAVIGLGIAMGLTPIGWMIAGFGLLTIAGITLMKKWDVVKDYFVGIFDAWKQTMSGLIDFIVGVFTLDLGRAFDGLTNLFSGAVIFWLRILEPVLWAVGAITDAVAGTSSRDTGPPVPKALPDDLRTLGVGGSGQPMAASHSRVTVDFRNLPAGTRVTSSDRNLPVNLEWARGLTMQGSH